MAFTFIDLFAGIGGFHYGLAQCGGKCVMASEIDPIAAGTYFWNYGINPLGDVCAIQSKDIPDFDVLCAGFPCQPFSNIGRKQGFNDVRGSMIFQVARILKDCKPKAFILENVKGLLTMDNGETIKTIYKMLVECGYSVNYKILSANDYGVPQKRRRLFIVGIRLDFHKFFIFPNPVGCDVELSDILGGKTDRRYSFTLRCGGRHSGLNNKHNWDCYLVDGKEHYLTVEECLQLQGFPKDFTLCGGEGQKYKQLGNSVPTVFISAIGKQLIKLGII